MKTRSINAAGRLITFERPLVMGILNVTPDSFFDGGRHNSLSLAVEQAERMLADGADIIDIGAHSSRPGAAAVSPQEELNRMAPVVEKLVALFPEAVLSIDTFRASVAEHAVKAGVHIVNDISGGSLDGDMFTTVARLQVPYILMHMRGTPQTMQQFAHYGDIATDLAVYFGEKVSELRARGLRDVIIDPGFGFAKTLEQNHELLRRVDELHYLGLPILAGVSRKSMIYQKLGITPGESLPGTIALNALLLDRGVHILRVHDVKETRQIVDLLC